MVKLLKKYFGKTLTVLDNLKLKVSDIDVERLACKARKRPRRLFTYQRYWKKIEKPAIA
jgi:hypothetical protein